VPSASAFAGFRPEHQPRPRPAARTRTARCAGAEGTRAYRVEATRVPRGSSMVPVPIHHRRRTRVGASHRIERRPRQGRHRARGRQPPARTPGLTAPLPARGAPPPVTSQTTGATTSNRQDDQRTTPVPPPTRHQLALIIWIAAFPTLTVLNLVLGDTLAGTPRVPRTFVLAMIAVPIVMYGLMPRPASPPRGPPHPPHILTDRRLRPMWTAALAKPPAPPASACWNSTDSHGADA
jgi:hypothetical protein